MRCRNVRWKLFKVVADKNILKHRLKKIRHVALDMDGTIYSGGTLFKSTIPFLAQLKQLGIGYTFLTNNSSKSTKNYLGHLKKIGIKASADELYTSTQATIGHLRKKFPRVKKLFVLGTKSLRKEFAAAGLVLTKDSDRRTRRGHRRI